MATKGGGIANPYYSNSGMVVGDDVGNLTESSTVSVSFSSNFTGSNVIVSAKGYSLI